MSVRFILLWIVLFIPTTKGHAQTNQPDYGQILRDIITQVPTSPIPLPNESSQIVTIDVTSDFDLQSDIADGHLVVKVVSDDTALQGVENIIGQTTVALAGLTSPVKLTLSIPRKAMNETNVMRLTGYIEDTNGQIKLRAESTPLISNPAPQFLALSVPTSSQSTVFKAPITTETRLAQGTVTLIQTQDMFAGSVLTVQLLSDGLAGSAAGQLKGETQIDILDPQNAIPFRFSFALPETENDEPLALKAFVKDWAGRTTHVMPGRIPYTDGDKAHRLTLDRIRQGAEVMPFDVSLPNPDPTIEPNLDAVEINVLGRASFNAYRGLPKGSQLNLDLWRTGENGTHEGLDATSVLLDGLSGDIDFELTTPAISRLSQLFMDATITTQQGLTLFEVKTFPVDTNYTVLPLTTNPNY